MDVKTKIGNLLVELCVDLGICLPPDDNAKIESMKCVDAETFARIVLRAEGLDPDADRGLFRQVKRRFTDKFGAEIGNEGDA